MSEKSDKMAGTEPSNPASALSTSNGRPAQKAQPKRRQKLQQGRVEQAPVESSTSESEQVEASQSAKVQIPPEAK
jgi:hypothetical protein